MSTSLPSKTPDQRKVLLTGAAGHIGKVLRARLAGRYGLLRLTDIAPQEPARAGEEVQSVDLRDADAVERSMIGIDCVVHLGGVPREDTWEKVLPMNIEGCYNVFEGARKQGVRRIVYASSNHVVGFHRREEQLDAHSELRPDSRYGVSKVFGEALGRLYADKYGLSVACLRIGSFRTPDQPQSVRELETWISHRDLTALVRCCVEHAGYSFLVAYGVSNNRRARWSNAAVQALGYRPVDDAETFAAELEARPATNEAVSSAFHGGPTCQAEFVGDPARVTGLPF